MILDMSGSTLGFRQTIQQSAFRFVDALAPNDRIAVIEFYDKVNLLNDFTENRKTVGHSISVANGRGKTQLYKAINLALQKLNGEGNRRKAIIVLTDGVDTDVRDNDRSFLEKIKEENILTAIVPDKSEILNRVLNRAGRSGRNDLPAGSADGRSGKISRTDTRSGGDVFRRPFASRTLAKRTGGTLECDQSSRRNGQILCRSRRRYSLALHGRISTAERKTRRQMARDKNRSQSPGIDNAHPPGILR